MLELVKPSLEELSFRRKLLADEPTMTYNQKWGGVIDFSRDRWEGWYGKWVEGAKDHLYRYLFSPEENAFVGEVAYHYDEEYKGYICDVIIKYCFRGRGYGKQALALLLGEAKKNGIDVVYDNIARDNPAIKLFTNAGFVEVWRNEDFIMLEKHL